MNNCKFRTPCGLCEIKSQFGCFVKCDCPGEHKERPKNDEDPTPEEMNATMKYYDSLGR